MIKTIEAVIDEAGDVHLLEPVTGGANRRALVVILDEPGAFTNETAVLSEAALRDWERPEEDAAWSQLQQAR